MSQYLKDFEIEETIDDTIVVRFKNIQFEIDPKDNRILQAGLEQARIYMINDIVILNQEKKKKFMFAMYNKHFNGPIATKTVNYSKDKQMNSDLIYWACDTPNISYVSQTEIEHISAPKLFEVV